MGVATMVAMVNTFTQQPGLRQPMQLQEIKKLEKVKH
jgi:hypothetical protein